MSSSSRIDSLPSPRSSSSASADAGPSVGIHGTGSLPARFFWGRSRAVAPAVSAFFDDHITDADGYSTGRATSEGEPDSNANARDVIFVSKPNKDRLDLRSMFFGAREPAGVIPTASIDASAGGPAASAAKRKRKSTRRRLRAKEELCLTLPRDGSRPKRSWFLGPGLIGREGGEHILVATKDASMDPVHAEISVDGDDYLLRDHHSSGGTFLCLSTIHRHYPQRDGFRLRRGDSFFIGLTTKVTVEELVTELAPPGEPLGKRRASDGLGLEDPATQSGGDSAEGPTAAETTRLPALRAKPGGERRISSRVSSRSGSSLGTLLEREGEAEAAAGAAEAVPTSDKALPVPPLSPKRRVRFEDTPPSASDGSVVRGTRYQRTRSTPKPPAYPRHRPVALTLSISDTSAATADATSSSRSREPRRVQLGTSCAASARDGGAPACKDVLLLGSSSACDVQLAAEDVHPVHARIVFDGFFFVLQDLSFDENPQRKTRVALTVPTRIARGDTLLLGQCELHVTTVSKAFRGRDRDMKEVAIRCRLLRVSKRKARAPGKFVTVGFRHQMQESFVFGKGRDCPGQVFTTALAVEQFSVQLDHGACMMTPKAAGINQGTYFLLGRDCMPHATERTPDLVRYSSKALMLVEGCIFKCGNSELEVVLVKSPGSHGSDSQTETDGGASARTPRSPMSNAELLENAELLGNLPWLQQIAFDKKMVHNVARRGRRLAMEPGDVVYDEGDAASFLFVVVEGEVELLSAIGDPSALQDAGEASGDGRRLPSRFESGLDGANGAASEQAPSDADVLTEFVGPGSFFGEISLDGPGMEFAESARASSEVGCVLLIFDREDLAGYLGMYMDIVRPHLALETQRETLHCLRLHVPWLASLSYNDLRLLVTRAERLQFDTGHLIVDGGRLLASAPSSPSPSSLSPASSPYAPQQQPQQREGLLLLVRGKALLTRPWEKQAKPKRKVSRRCSYKALVSAFSAVIDTDGDFATDSRELPSRFKADEEEEEEVLGDKALTQTADDVVDVGADGLEESCDGCGEGEESSDATQEEWWRHVEPLTLLPSTADAVSSCVVSLEARSRVECFFLDAVHVAHLASAPIATSEAGDAKLDQVEDDPDATDEHQNRVKPLLLRKPTHRRSSFAAMHQRLQSSQIITKGLNAASTEDEEGEGDARAAPGAEDDGPARRWRRKKRNKNVLEKILLETQEDPELPSALVVYVLSGANRGDVHVVRNVATLGAVKSGADIELNDRYVSASQAVIEHHDGRYWLYDDFSEWGTFVRLEENNPVEIHPGDIFLAGEVEFMCLGAFPERKKSLSCCLQ